MNSKIARKIKESKSVKLFLRDRILRLENKDIRGVKLGGVFAEELTIKSHVNLVDFSLMLRTMRPDLIIHE